MTDAATMKAEAGLLIKKHLAHLEPVPGDAASKIVHPKYNELREALSETEVELRKLIRGGEEEVHEWLAVIHYALSEERDRLL